MNPGREGGRGPSGAPPLPESPSPTPLSVGIAWAYRVTAIGLEFALPAVLGFVLDRRWDSEPIATLVGAGLGFAAGLLHLVQLARPVGRDDRRRPPPP